MRAKVVGKFRDGGTTKVLATDGKHYWVDHRIGSKTKGQVYDRYPGEEGAILLKSLILDIRP